MRFMQSEVKFIYFIGLSTTKHLLISCSLPMIAGDTAVVWLLSNNREQAYL